MTGSIAFRFRVRVDLVINPRVINFKCHILVHWRPKRGDNSLISHPPVSPAKFSGPEKTPLIFKLDFTVGANLTTKRIIIMMMIVIITIIIIIIIITMMYFPMKPIQITAL